MAQGERILGWASRRHGPGRADPGLRAGLGRASRRHGPGRADPGLGAGLGQPETRPRESGSWAGSRAGPAGDTAQGERILGWEQGWASRRHGPGRADPGLGAGLGQPETRPRESGSWAGSRAAATKPEGPEKLPRGLEAEQQRVELGLEQSGAGSSLEAMAAANPAKTLQDELTCPICLEYFKDPVSLGCDHSFCRACITQCRGGFATHISCPQCRKTFPQRNLRLNRQLRNIVEAARKLRLQTGREPAPERLCEKHKEPFKLFCEEDKIPICLVCDRSKEHKDHIVIPAEEAAEEFKEKIQAHLKTLREEREMLLGFKVSGEKRSQEYLRNTQTERQKIVSEFQQLRQFLEEQERLFQAQLEKLDKEIVKIQNESVSKLSEEISRLSDLIRELEGKCQKPVTELLQDVRSTLIRSAKGKFQQLEEISTNLELRLGDFSQKIVALMDTLRKFKDTLPSALETPIGESLGAHRQANVTLDPDTAHPILVLSEDQKNVRWGYKPSQMPKNGERFDSWACVLGCEGFTSGRHCWEVEMDVGGEECWAVGVARASMMRKGRINLSPDEGIWAVGLWLGQFRALTSPEETSLPLSQFPNSIRVCLDCDRGQVTFIDADDGAQIFTFPPGSVPRERLRPWFWLGQESQLSLCL
ncbi:zinc finger protein RFP isoform X1 [Caretta caretta]|uniref:zinc finger protein RFP isoform X1 n=2 Tax=Caretta caretta TaxID=8467 RepID=UPI003F4CA57A